MKPETYEWAFKEAGFTHFEWYRLIVDPQATKEEKEYLQQVIDHPFNIGVIAW